MNPVPEELAAELERVRAVVVAALRPAVEAVDNAQAAVFAAVAQTMQLQTEAIRVTVEHALGEPRRFAAAVERWAFDNAEELAAAPITGTAGNARAHRARIHARYLARRAVRERSATHFPGSDDEQRTTTHGLARVLAFAAERARVIAAELVDTAPAAAAVLAAVAKCWHELCVRLLELVHCTPQHPTRCTRGLAPPGRHPLSVAVAAHAPPGGRVCHARPNGRIHAFTDPGPP